MEVCDLLIDSIYFQLLVHQKVLYINLLFHMIAGILLSHQTGLEIVVWLINARLNLN